MTIAEFTQKLQNAIGIRWLDKTVDGLIEGDPTRDISGIAVCMMPTYEILEQARAAGCNLIVSHESPSYDHQGNLLSLAEDPVYKIKRDFVVKNQLNLFRFHDHPHRMAPDQIAAGMARRLGWLSQADSPAAGGPVKPAPAIPTGLTRESGNIAVTPADVTLTRFSTRTTLAALVKEIKAKISQPGVRYLGDPAMPVETVLTAWGFCGRDIGLDKLRGHQNCALIVGETHEWELVEYVRDSIRLGNAQALVVAGHVVTEDAGMEYCADWLRTVFPGLDIRHIPGKNPYGY